MLAYPALMMRTPLLLLLMGCAPLSRSAPARPPAAPPVAHRVVWIGGSPGAICARTAAGALFCWGLVTRPGGSIYAETPRPLPIPGLPPLAAFSFAGHQGGFTAVDLQGGLLALFRPWSGSAFGPPAIQRSVRLRPPHSGPLDHHWPPFSGPVLDARHECLLGADRRPLCEVHSVTSEYGPAFAPIPVVLSALGGNPLAGIGPAGEPLAWNLYEHEHTFFGRRVGPFQPFRLPLPAPATDVVLSWEPQLACATSPTGAVTCTEPRLTARMSELAAGHAVRALDLDGSSLLCILRDDGERRCQRLWGWPRPRVEPRRERLLGVLAGLDASLGFANGGEDVLCVLGKDRVPRCWGKQGSPLLGDGSTSELPAPVRLPDYAGVTDLTADDGITCARFGSTRIRCFGMSSYEMGWEHDLRLPEPVSEMRGASTLCVHGETSGRWHCRDAVGDWFHRSLPDGFEPLHDASGRLLGGDLASLEVRGSERIEVTRRDGSVGRFSFEAHSKPLRFTFAPPGTPRMDPYPPPAPPPPGTPKLVQVAGSCGRTAAGDLWCWGARRHLPGPLDRLEPRPVTLP